MVACQLLCARIIVASKSAPAQLLYSLNSVATIVINLINCQPIVINCLINLLSFCLKALVSSFTRLLKFVFTIAPPSVSHYLRPRELNSKPSTLNPKLYFPPCQPPLYPFPVLKKDGRSRPSSLCFLCQKRCTPSLCRLRVVIHSIHDSFVEIRGGLSYHLRSRHRTAFVILIIPLSSPFSYHFRSTK